MGQPNFRFVSYVTSFVKIIDVIFSERVCVRESERKHAHIRPRTPSSS